MTSRKLTGRKPFALVALSLLAAVTPVGHAVGKPISDETRLLRQQWESLQLRQISLAASGRNEHPTIQAYLLPPETGSCTDYSARLNTEFGNSAVSEYRAIDELCIAELNSDRLGNNPLAIIETADDNTPGSTTTLPILINSETEEIFVRIADANAAHQVELWPKPASIGNAASPWWKRAFGWIPGISSRSIEIASIATARPQWQWLGEKCGSANKPYELAKPTLTLLQQNTTGTLTTNELEIITNCVIALEWPVSASNFIAQWEATKKLPSALKDARLRLAGLLYKTGSYVEVVEQIDPDDFQDLNRTKASHIVGMALIALGRHSEAVDVLGSGPHLATQANTALLEAEDNPSLFMRYNLSTALIGNGQKDEALAVLDALGSHPSNSPFSAALIERANLALGWLFIKQGNAGSAAPVFERIRVNGPFARRATLGLGWSWVLNGGERQKRVAEPVHATQSKQSPVIVRALYQSKQISCQEYRDAIGDQNICTRSPYFSQTKVESEVQRSENAVHVWAYLLDQDFADLTSIETAVQLSKTLKDQEKIEPAGRILNKAISAIQDQQASIHRWKSKTRPTSVKANPDTPDELNTWWLDAEPTLLREMLITINAHKQLDSHNLDSEWHQLEQQLVSQLRSLVKKRSNDYLTQLDSYLSEAYLLRGALFDLANKKLSGISPALTPLDCSALKVAHNDHSSGLFDSVNFTVLN